MVHGIRFTRKQFTFACLCLMLSIAAACSRLSESPRQNEAPNTAAKPAHAAADSVHLALGNPSGATADPTNADNFLVIGEGSGFSYNNSRGTINWISWKTTAKDLGETVRRPDFRPDPRLPSTFRRISYYDYSGGGYDRGHMVPSADRFANPRLNEETFMMTNIVPQAGALNQFPWEKLETYVRRQARRGFDVYQIAGVYGELGILKRKIIVPTNCWKIIVFVRPGTTVSRIDGRTRIIAVDMPNREGMEEDNWQKYRTSIRAIEEKTGFDFLSVLPRAIQDAIEIKVEMLSP